MIIEYLIKFKKNNPSNKEKFGLQNYKKAVFDMVLILIVFNFLNFFSYSSLTNIKFKIKIPKN